MNSKSFTYFIKSLNKSGPIISSTSSLFSIVIGFTLVGYYVDILLDTSPWFLLACLFLGVFMGLYNIYKIVNKD